MSRWKSPQTAAKHAERAAKEAEQRRAESRKSRWMIIGLAVVSVSLLAGDYFWLRARAQRRQAEHQRLFHEKTNALPTTITNPGAFSVTNAREKD